LGQLVVSKFGGSSVADACAFKRCAKIINDSEDQHFVVVSATYDTTNQLEKLAQISLDSIEKANDFLLIIIKRHQGISIDLNISEEVSSVFKSLESEAKSYIQNIHNTCEISLKQMDALYSIGERLSSSIMSMYLDAEYIDATKILRTDDYFGAANPMSNISKALAEEVLIPLIKNKKTIVTQGFIASTIEGHITTLGREGSDYSASLFGELIKADQINIWTDVPGIFSCDPKKAEGVKRIPELSYSMATKFASLGAKVLFPRTLAPARRANIKVFVGSSLSPEKGGTFIGHKEATSPSFLGIAQELINDELNVSLIGNQLIELKGFEPKNYLEKNGISFSNIIEQNDFITFQIPKECEKLAIRILHDYLLSFLS
jgi:aspartate kinase